MGRYRYRRMRRTNRRFLATAVIAGGVLAAAASHTTGGASGAGQAAAGTRMTSASSNVALGQQMAASYGWGGGSEWTCLDWLWTRESGWSSTAANPYSDARGIAQNINGWSTSYQYGNAPQQIGWGLSYIANTPYGTHTPCGAWAHEVSAGWY